MVESKISFKPKLAAMDSITQVCLDNKITSYKLYINKTACTCAYSKCKLKRFKNSYK